MVDIKSGLGGVARETVIIVNPTAHNLPSRERLREADRWLPDPGGGSTRWGREVGIPRRPVDAVRACVQGERRRIDLGRTGQRYFLLMAGYGLDGLISDRVSLRAKRYLGAVAYALTAVRESLSYRISPLPLRLDAEIYK